MQSFSLSIENFFIATRFMSKAVWRLIKKNVSSEDMIKSPTNMPNL